MESLLCDEVWVASPVSTDHFYDHKQCVSESCDCSFYMTKEEAEQAFTISLEKEFTYIPKPGYVEHLQLKDLINARFRAIQWLIKCRSRLNLSFATIFCAANYLDRFLSMCHCHEWKYWMVELLSVACLSIASKFSEISTPLLHEIQVEDLNHSFHSRTIQQMELILLQALGWRLGATTTYSYLELLTPSIESSRPHLHKDLITQVTELLLRAILDWKLLEYPPSVVAVSALGYSLEELISSKSDAHLACITRLFNQDQKDNLAKCQMIMKDRFVTNPSDNLMSSGCPSSPVTVLLREPIKVDNCHVDLSLFELPGGSNANPGSTNKKRKRGAL